MATITRLPVPSIVRARALYIAQQLQIPLYVALGCMILDATQRMNLEDQLEAARGVLNQFRASLSEDTDRPDKEGI